MISNRSVSSLPFAEAAPTISLPLHGLPAACVSHAGPQERYVCITISEDSVVPEKEPVIRRLNFGIDIDGTITQAPSHFKRLIDSVHKAGNRVYIITARDDHRREETEGLLNILGIYYDELWMKPYEWPGTVPEWKVKAVKETNCQLMFDDEEPNCWAIQQETKCLAAHALPIPELQQEYVELLEEWDRRMAVGQASAGR